MTALSNNRDTPEITGRGRLSDLTVLNDAVLYAGAMLALDSSLEVQPAADTLGLRVLGRCPAQVDNAADGEESNVAHGIFRYANASGAAAVTQALIGQPCYVVDDQTVGATSTYLVTAGLVYDVDSAGVWVDQRLEALAAARALARPVVVAVTGSTESVTAAEAFAGNVVITADNATGVTLTLPSAVAGYRLGVQRLAATAAHDVVVQAASGDTVRGSAAAGTITNDTDAVSQVLYLEAENSTNWADAAPLASDRAEWTAST